ncbi:hypothetical protein D3C71_1100600 [compost metagenome]
MLELVADDFAQEFMVPDFLDQIETVFQFGYIAAGMGEDDLFELFIGLWIADQACERCNAGAGREHIEPSAWCQRIQNQSACRLLAHKHGVAGLDRLKMRGQRAIRNLDREKFEFLVPGRAGDGISAVDRLFADHQADHGEFAGTEAEAGRTRHAETEQVIRIVFHRQNCLGVNTIGYLDREIFRLGWRVHFRFRPFIR